MLELSKLVKKDQLKWFHFADDGLGGVELVENEDEATFSLELKYLGQRELRKFISKSSTRKAVSKHGIKAILTGEDQFRSQLCKAVLMDWKLTVRGAYALAAECDFSHLNQDEEIPFDDGNIDVMIRHSQLSNEVYTVIQDHDAWFELSGQGDEEEERKNLQPGQSSTSDG